MSCVFKRLGGVITGRRAPDTFERGRRTSALDGGTSNGKNRCERSGKGGPREQMRCDLSGWMLALQIMVDSAERVHAGYDMHMRVGVGK